MKNYFKTFLLLATLSFILIFIGGIFGGQQGVELAFIIALAMNVGTYFFSDKLALSASHAQPIREQAAPELYQAVRELADQFKIPMPRIYITPSMQANAFATGRNPKHASIAVTQGLLNLLPIYEIKAVLAHELAHVKNRDILITTIAAVIASSIAFLANFTAYGNMMGNNKRNQNGVLEILAIILLPIAATLLQLSISRQREFAADYIGAKTLGTGKPLAEALQAIEQSINTYPNSKANPAFSSLYIQNPLGGRNNPLKKLFSTHPPTDERIRRLLKI